MSSLASIVLGVAVGLLGKSWIIAYLNAILIVAAPSVNILLGKLVVADAITILVSALLLSKLIAGAIPILISTVVLLGKIEADFIDANCSGSAIDFTSNFGPL